MSPVWSRVKEAGQDVWSLHRTAKYLFSDHVTPRRRPESSGKVRFHVGWRRFVPFIGYHHVLMLIGAISITFLGILLAGCSSTSPGLVNVYLLRIAPLVNPGYTIHVGYLGVCLKLESSHWFCSNDEMDLLASIPPGDAQRGALSAALAFKNDILFPWLLVISASFMFITILLLATFPGWHEEVDARTGSEVDVKPFPSRPVSQVAAYLSFGGAFFTLASSIWHHVGAVATISILSVTDPTTISCDLGAVALGFTWAAFGANCLVLIGLVVMIISIMMLDVLTDE